MGATRVIAKIEIDIKTVVMFLLVVSGFIATLFLLWQLLPVVLLVGVSFFLAIALNKPVSGLARRLPGHSRPLATAMSYVIFILVLGLFLSLVVPPIIAQTALFIDSIPKYVNQLGAQRGMTAELITRYQLHDELDSFIGGVQGQAGVLAQGLGSNVVTGVSTIINGFVTLVTVLVLTFLMLIEAPRWKALLWRSYSNVALLERHQKLAQRMYHVVTSYVNGQVLVATIAGSLATLVLFVLTLFFSVPASLVLPLGFIVLLTSLIPMIGATIGAMIVVVVLLFNDFGSALVFLAYFLVYQQVENNAIQPVVQSRTVELSALTVFIAAICGIVLFGLVGGILAIPVAGCLRVLLLDYVEHRYKSRKSKHKLAAQVRT